MAVMVVMFVLGFFMDTIEIVLIVVPITAPVIIAMGVNPVWLGVMIGVNLQTAFLTPPVGFALFYMRAVAPESISTGAIYKGIIPFVILQIAGIAILWAAPELATWLPKQVFPDAVPGAASGQPGSVLDDILKAPSARRRPSRLAARSTAQSAADQRAGGQRSHPRSVAGQAKRKTDR